MEVKEFDRYGFSIDGDDNIELFKNAVDVIKNYGYEFSDSRTTDEYIEYIINDWASEMSELRPCITLSLGVDKINKTAQYSETYYHSREERNNPTVATKMHTLYEHDYKETLKNTIG